MVTRSKYSGGAPGASEAPRYHPKPGGPARKEKKGTPPPPPPPDRASVTGAALAASGSGSGGGAAGMNSPAAGEKKDMARLPRREMAA